MQRREVRATERRDEGILVRTEICVTLVQVSFCPAVLLNDARALHLELNTHFYPRKGRLKEGPGEGGPGHAQPRPPEQESQRRTQRELQNGGHLTPPSKSPTRLALGDHPIRNI